MISRWSIDSVLDGILTEHAHGIIVFNNCGKYEVTKAHMREAAGYFESRERWIGAISLYNMLGNNKKVRYCQQSARIIFEGGEDSAMADAFFNGQMSRVVTQYFKDGTVNSNEEEINYVLIAARKSKEQELLKNMKPELLVCIAAEHLGEYHMAFDMAGIMGKADLVKNYQRVMRLEPFVSGAVSKFSDVELRRFMGDEFVN